MRTALMILAGGTFPAVAVIGCLTLGGTSWPPRWHRNRRHS